jgi:hypothetical protein
VRNATCIVDVLAGTAATLAARSLPVVVKLQGNPNDIVAGALHKCCDYGRIDAARHRDHDANRRRCGAIDQLGKRYVCERTRHLVAMHHFLKTAVRPLRFAF